MHGVVDGQNMLSMLKQQYPSQLMPQLAQHSQGALEAAAAAFPGKRRVDESNLQLFVTAVEVHRRTLHLKNDGGPHHLLLARK